MKVGILTFHWANNYGAVLQAYALCHVLNDMGHQVRFIDYAPESLRLRGWQGWGLRSGKELPARALWRMRFAWFRQRYLPTTRRCRTKEALNQVARDFDAVIVGSDQVWNGNIAATFDPTYFLDFVEEQSCRKISYAACFGTWDQPEHTINNAGVLLDKFTDISVRNDMSGELVESLSGKNPKIVSDPTLLHHYDELTRDLTPKKYIAAYLLGHPSIEEGLEILQLIKKKLKLPILSIGHDVNIPWAESCSISAGPIQWVNILKNADFIFTNSFHATIFSTKFKKPFLVWSAKMNKGFRGPERMMDLLNRYGLNERIVFEPNADDIDNILNKSINYNSIELFFKKNSANSIRFLQDALVTSPEKIA